MALWNMNRTVTLSQTNGTFLMMGSKAVTLYPDSNRWGVAGSGIADSLAKSTQITKLNLKSFTGRY